MIVEKILYPIKVKVHSHFAFLCIFLCNLMQTLRMGLTQHAIDVMLQFDANAHAHANIDASVNGPLQVSL